MSDTHAPDERVEEEDEEEDYMAMVFAEPAAATKETTLQRRARLKREGELKSRAKSKAEIEAEAKRARDEALTTSIDSSNKGFKMLSKMGYKPGSALGVSADARLEPILIEMREDRGGIGLDTEKKRKVREAMASEAKRVKADADDYRERMRMEQERRRCEGQVIGAMKVARSLDEETDATGEEGDSGEESAPARDTTATSHIKKPLKSINVLWRALIRQQLEKEQDRRAERALQTRTSRLPEYVDPDEDDEDVRALGTDAHDIFVEDDLEEEDPELDEFNGLEPSEQLEKLVLYLREQHQYCFWCKKRYPDKDFEGCPGITEEDHD